MAQEILKPIFILVTVDNNDVLLLKSSVILEILVLDSRVYKALDTLLR